MPIILQDNPQRSQDIPILSATQQMAISGFLSRAYGWMTLGLAVTGLVSYLMVTSEAAMTAITQNRWLMYGALLGELGLVIALSAMYQRLSAAGATLGFLAYSALNGVTFSILFLIYSATSIAHVFLITAGMFGGLALLGTITKKDLSAVGTFFMMGIWGLILIGLVNIFVHSESLSMGLAVGGVLIFAGLTAYDAQRLKAMAYQYAVSSGSSDETNKGAVFGALTLYLNFINLFLNLLRLFGSRRE